METQEYYSRIMGVYLKNQGRRSISKYCQDKSIDYQLIQTSIKEFRPIHPPGNSQVKRDSDVTPLPVTYQHFIPLAIENNLTT